MNVSHTVVRTRRISCAYFKFSLRQIKFIVFLGGVLGARRVAVAASEFVAAVNASRCIETVKLHSREQQKICLDIIFKNIDFNN